MATPQKIETVLAVWPGRPGVREFGDTPTLGGLGYDTLHLEFRAVVPVGASPEAYVPHHVSQAISGVGLRIYIGEDGAMLCDARMRATSANLECSEELLRVMRKACKALTLCPRAKAGHIAAANPAILAVLGALGVKRSVEYRPGNPDLFNPIGGAVERVFLALEEKFRCLRGGSAT